MASTVSETAKYIASFFWGRKSTQANKLPQFIHQLENVANEKRACSIPHACLMEDIEIAGLNSLKKLDEEHSKSLKFSDETFEEHWNSIQKNGKVLDLLTIPTFQKEREQVAKAFQGTDSEEKQDAIKLYKESVEKELRIIAEKRSTEEKESAKK